MNRGFALPPDTLGFGPSFRSQNLNKSFELEGATWNRIMISLTERFTIRFGRFHGIDLPPRN